MTEKKRIYVIDDPENILDNRGPFEAVNKEAVLDDLMPTFTAWCDQEWDHIPSDKISQYAIDQTVEGYCNEYYYKIHEVVRKVTLHNDYHNTEVTVIPPANGHLSARQTRRVEKALCGMSDCTCGTIRGHQEVMVEYQPDGALWVDNVLID